MARKTTSEDRALVQAIQRLQSKKYRVHPRLVGRQRRVLEEILADPEADNRSKTRAAQVVEAAIAHEIACMTSLGGLAMKSKLASLKEDGDGDQIVGDVHEDALSGEEWADLARIQSQIEDNPSAVSVDDLRLYAGLQARIGRAMAEGDEG